MNEIYRKNGIDIVITHFPYRKKPCLAIREKGAMWKVASFNDEETVEWFVEKFEKWCGIEGRKNDNAD